MKTRRGAAAFYLDINHRDIKEFLNAKDLLNGDVRERIDSNIAVIIDNAFMDRIYAGEKEALELFCEVLKLRMKFGSPYIQFIDTCRDADPPWYKDKGLFAGASNLCQEIILHHDAEHTYACVLSSLNLDKYPEWSQFKFKGLGGTFFTVPYIAILFLDAVNQELIDIGKKIPGMEKAVRGAEKGRPLGLGTLGLHSLYQRLNLAFDDPEAYALNIKVHKYIQDEAILASQALAQQKGEPEWCEGWGRRNTHLGAIAPTMTNSVLCNAGSPGIEPVTANYYAMTGAKGTFVRYNKYFKELLRSKGKDTGSVWASIRNNNGSVQHLNFLTDREKQIFRTALEINQAHIIRQAADRQKYIDQGQSVNLFFTEDADAQYIVNMHLLAHKLKLKGLYYVRSESSMQDVIKESEELNYVFLYTRPDCPYCEKAKSLLEQYGIPYETEYKSTGKVPEIWLAGEKLDNGYESLLKRLEVSTSEITVSEPECEGCDG